MAVKRPRVIVGIDGSPESEQAARWAARYSRDTGGSLGLVAAWEWPTTKGEPIPVGSYDPRAVAISRLNRLLTESALPTDRVDAHVERGDASRILLGFAEDSDLLVVGSHGAGALSRWLLGSVSTRCAMHATVPVAVVRSSDDRRGIVAGLDETSAAASALAWAMDYAELVHESLTVVHAIDVSPRTYPPAYPLVFRDPEPALTATARAWVDDVVAKVVADRGRSTDVPPAVDVAHGRPAPVLVERSDNALVTVVGRRGMSGARHFPIGSVASAVVHHATWTVVVVPGR